MKAARKKQEEAILELVCEAGLLKRVQRSGWWVLGIKNAESVAEHSFRCAVVGYVLAHMEQADAYKVLVMCLFGDMHEARITDLHKMAQRYIEAEEHEEKSFYEQIEKLPENLREELSASRSCYRAQADKESIVARDADILECLIQAKEYYEHGFKEAEKFMKKAPRHLKTKSAKKLWQLAKKTNLNEWWMKLSEFKR